MIEHIEDIPIFFIIGRPRTGTSLLRTLFDAHPNVNIPIECQFIIDLYPRYGKITLWDQNTINAFLGDLNKVLFCDKWTVDEAGLKKHLNRLLGKSSYGSICKAVIYSYQSFFSKKKILLLGDKNPGYTIYTEKLLKIFPEAKFIYINRDYRDNFISLSRVDFELPIISLVTYKWKYFYKSFLQAVKKNPEKFCYLKYESLASEPKKEFSKLCEFVGIQPDDSVFDFHKHKDRVRKIYDEEEINKYHASLFKPITTKNVGVWEKSLPTSSVKLADYIAGRYAEKAGYKPKYTAVGPGIKLMALPGIFGGKLLYMLTNIINAFPYRMRQCILSRGPLLIGNLYLRIFKKGRNHLPASDQKRNTFPSSISTGSPSASENIRS